jgi:hypothetical protein
MKRRHAVMAADVQPPPKAYADQCQPQGQEREAAPSQDISPSLFSSAKYSSLLIVHVAANHLAPPVGS